MFTLHSSNGTKAMAIKGDEDTATDGVYCGF